MAALGFLFILVGIAAIIFGAHSQTLWSGLGKYFSSSSSGSKA